MQKAIKLLDYSLTMLIGYDEGMPYCNCPSCGTTFYINVVNIAAWYKNRWPMFKVGDVVPEECPKCCKERLDQDKNANQKSPD